MRLSAATSLPAPKRLRALIDDIAWGSDAHALGTLDRRRNLHISLLPQQVRIETDTRTGRRTVDSHIAWEHGSVLVVPRVGETRVRWRVLEQGAGRSGSAVFSVSSTGQLEHTGYPTSATAPEPVETQPNNYPDALTNLIKRGELAMWELVSELEPYVHVSLEASNRRVAREIEGDDPDAEIDLFVSRSNHGAVDRVALEKLAGELLFGTETVGANSRGSVILRMCRRCATSHAANQPLASYFSVNISRAAEEVIRREIGDPHIGRKVRRLQRELGTPDLATLIEAYNRVHPQDELGRKRAVAALSAGKTIDSVSFGFENGLHQAEVDVPGAAALPEHKQLVDSALEAVEQEHTLQPRQVQVLRGLAALGIDLADSADQRRLEVWLRGGQDAALDDLGERALAAQQRRRETAA